MDHIRVPKLNGMAVKAKQDSCTERAGKDVSVSLRAIYKEELSFKWQDVTW